MYFNILILSAVFALLSVTNGGIVGSNGGVAHLNWVNSQKNNTQITVTEAPCNVCQE